MISIFPTITIIIVIIVIIGIAITSTYFCVPSIITYYVLSL